MPTTPKSDDVTLFSMESIESDPQILLIREGLVLMAVLIGGDYDEVSELSYVYRRVC
jgi:hypothetical protein